ncbi:arginase [Paenibacillus thailandensis]|uniref:Arginase n=1 Tax=Paenibacillus thailandensis TaxID=393250 RepID=A0ABW5QXY5_9BACL
MERDVEVLSVPFGLGAGVSGSEHGPEAVVAENLLHRLRASGRRVRHRIIEADGGAVRSKRSSAVFGAPAPVDRSGDSGGKPGDAGCAFRSGANGGPEGMKHEAEVLAINMLLAKETAEAAKQGRFPLVIGGDHSIAIGSLAGLASHYRKLGVIWFDAHADLNTELTSPSGNMHGIPLAVGLNRSRLKLADVWRGAMPLRPERMAIVAARDIDPGEKELIREAGIRLFAMKEIRERGIERVMLEALHIAGNGADGVHFSFDIDSVDPLEAPGTGTPVPEGLTSHEAYAAFGVLRRAGRITSMDAVEVNPLLDGRGGRTAKLAAKLIVSLFK